MWVGRDICLSNKAKMYLYLSNTSNIAILLRHDKGKQSLPLGKKSDLKLSFV